ncbi:MAG: lipoprotein transmembrane [Alphaproteobacteria bacterium]|nr:lipoprotein transmembrane [Alphaproteobacteria bacterium]
MTQTWRRAGAAACWLWLAAVCIFLALKFSGQPPVDSDILALLPHGDADQVESAAVDLAGRAAAGRTAILITAPDGPTASAAADDLTRELSKDGLFVSDTQEAAVTSRWFFENRNQLLCQRDPATFTAEDARRIQRRALADIYSVTGAVTGDLLKQDPFLLTIRLAECLPPTGAAAPKANQRLVSGRISASAYQLDAEDEVVAAFDLWKSEWAPKGVTAARAGAVFHAHAAAEKAKGEVTLIGSLGAAGVILIFFLAFRTARAVVSGILLVGIGVASGLAATLLVFPTVHVLVFVFAAMLVGIVSDYAVHTLATGPATDWADTDTRLKLILRPITTSMATTVLGFSALALFGVALFQQVAILAGVGVFTAWAFVLFVLVPLDKRPANADFLSGWWRKLETLRDGLKIPSPVVWGASVLLLAVSIYGATQIRFLDDVRQFQPRPADLMVEEEIVKAAGYGGSGVAFLLSEGADAEQAREREEAAIAQAPADLRVLATTRFDPSKKRRVENQSVLQRLLYEPLLADQTSQTGVDPAINPASLPPPADVPRPSWLTELSGKAGGKTFLVAPVLNAGAWSGPKVEGVRLVDPTERYGSAFRTYRQHAITALAVALVCAGLVAMLIYRRIAAISILVPPLLAVIVALLAAPALGEPLTFFSFAAALVLVGTGLDYSAFQWEGGLKHESWTSVAVAITAITTLLSLGLLALSDMLPVRSFGLTVSIGIAAALCLSHIPRLAAMKGTKP